MIVECKAPSIKISQDTFDQIARYNMSLNKFTGCNKRHTTFCMYNGQPKPTLSFFKRNS